MQSLVDIRSDPSNGQRIVLRAYRRAPPLPMLDGAPSRDSPRSTVGQYRRGTWSIVPLADGVLGETIWHGAGCGRAHTGQVPVAVTAQHRSVVRAAGNTTENPARARVATQQCQRAAAACRGEAMAGELLVPTWPRSWMRFTDDPGVYKERASTASMNLWRRDLFCPCISRRLGEVQSHAYRFF